MSNEINRFVKRQTTLKITLTFIGQHDPDSLRASAELLLKKDFSPAGGIIERCQIADTFEVTR